MSEEFSIDWPHGHQTRDGRKARIICTDRHGWRDFPIVALVVDENGHEVPTIFTASGRHRQDEMPLPSDLINAPAPDWEKIAREYHAACEEALVCFEMSDKAHDTRTISNDINWGRNAIRVAVESYGKHFKCR